MADLELVAFVRRCLDEDERAIAGSGTLGWLTYRHEDGSMAYTAPASLAGDGTWTVAGAEASGYANAVIVHRERERLAEVEAKRATLDWAVTWLERDCAPWNADLIRMLAMPYAGREGWREEWRDG